MSKEGQVWEFVKARLPELKCKEAETTFWNGGDPISTEFVMRNRAGLGPVWLVCPSRADQSVNVFPCGDDVSELRISRRGKGLVVHVETRGGSRDGSDHARVIEGLFGESAYDHLEKSILQHHIRRTKEKLRIAQATLKRVEEA